jgi:magnesium transporter
LIVAEPYSHISEFMIHSVVSLPVDADLQQIAHKFERYKLLAIPVHDHDNRLIGIITVDDTLEQILPDNWRKRPTKRPDRLERDRDSVR